MSFLNQKIDWAFGAVCAIILGLIIFKIPFLHLPFYWDEAWVYGSAVRMMADGSLSFLPDALPVDFTRGHPLLFHFLGALWLKIFGNTIFASHLFSLMISLALIFAIYFFGKEFFGKWVGVIAVFLLSVQTIFLAQSTLVLPEMLLALFSMLTLYFFLKNNNSGYLIFATAALFTKETGVVVVASSLLWYVIENLFLQKRKFTDKYFLRQFAILMLPVLFIVVFFFIQRIQHGWFFFPEHLQRMELTPSHFLDQLAGYSAYVFIYWGRNLLSAMIVVSIIAFIYFRKFTSAGQNKAIVLMSIFIILYLFFSAVNFYSPRYMMSAIPPFIMVVSFFIFNFFSNKKVLIAFLIVFSVIQIKYIRTKSNSDHNLGFVDVIEVHKEMIDYCTSHKMHDKNIFATFIMQNYLTNYYAGYVSDGIKFNNVSPHFNQEIEYCLFSNVEGETDYAEIKNSQKLQLLMRFEKNKAWTELYQVVN